MSGPIKILLADDNPVHCRLMTKILSDIPDVIVVGTASNGKIALSKLKYTAVDLVLMDIEMPIMDGVEALREVTKIYSDVGVLMISGAYDKEASKVVEALQIGALDYLPKLIMEDQNSLRDFRLRLLTLIGMFKTRKNMKLALTKITREPYTKKETPSLVKDQTETRCEKKQIQIPTKIDILVIATSTGGPNALQELIPKLPSDMDIPIFLVQHMPAFMTASLASSLNIKSPLTVVEASDNDEVLPNTVYIAPGGKHMTVVNEKFFTLGTMKKRIKINEDPPENSVRPAADVLFRSVAEAYKGNILAVVMTGMGSDGFKGVEVMKKYGCYCITQSSETCVVYGMPRVIDEAGLSDEKIPLKKIAERIDTIIKVGKRK
ncbi:MAG: chemotaxis-specific protein-glutamate methyltransferase CheB [Desulfobacterales bacterium]|nr:chemotaxis-specific protein-glutamate methyltransferase CheB [Desulfobacterales bacterium]